MLEEREDAPDVGEGMTGGSWTRISAWSEDGGVIMDDWEECTRGVEDEGVELADEVPEVGCFFKSEDSRFRKPSIRPLFRMVVIRSK